MHARKASIETTIHEPGENRMDTIDISAVLYQEGGFWIAQGLEYDVTAQASSLPDLHEKFAMKIATEISISLDLGREPLEGVAPAPKFFWQMFSDAKITVSAEAPPVRVEDGARVPRIIPRMKVGQPLVAA